MIGQSILIDQINNTMEKSIPRFMIIIGKEGSGKKLISNYIINSSGFLSVNCDIKIENVRECIDTAYNTGMDTIYTFFDCDNMSISAKNALLKVTEEPPRNSYFILTACDKSKILPTLISRGQIFQIFPYTSDELILYMKKLNIPERYYNYYNRICEVPGDIDALSKYNVNEFMDYADRVVDNIGGTNISNALKIGQRLKIWQNSVGWNISLFIKAVQLACLEIYKQDRQEQYYRAIHCCRYYSQQCGIVGINKLALVDSWLINLREILIDR